MKWQNKIGIGELGLIAFVIFLLIAFWFDIIEWHWSHVFFILAEAALSVWITLVVIELAIRKDRERKWKRVKLITYTTILNNLRNIANEAASYAFLVVGNCDDQFIKEYARILSSEGNKPRKEVSIAIIEMAIIITTYYKNIKEEHNNLDEKKMVKSLTDYYHKEHWRLDDIMVTLSPRILELSDDEEANLALLRFENANRIFEDMMELQQKSELDSDPVATYALAILLKEAGILYDILLRGMVAVPETDLIKSFIIDLKIWWSPFEP